MRQKVSRWNKKIVITAAAAVIAVTAAAGIWLMKGREEPVLKLGDHAISQEHLELYENDLRAQVTSYFYNQYQADPNEEGFWEMSFDGEVPGDMLRKEAMDQLVYDTVERIEASERGLDIEITLGDIKKSLEQTNKARKDPDSISYGPSQYGLEEYISRTQMEAQDYLMEKLLKEELVPTEEELQAVYEAQDPAMFDKGSKATVGIFMYYGMKVGEYPEELKEVWQFIQAGLEEGKDPEQLLDEANSRFQTQIAYDVAEYDTEDLPRDNQEISWLVEQTRDMETGQVSQVLDYGPSQGVLKILEKTDYGTFAFEESRAFLTNLWLQDSYPAYIRQCAESYGYTFE